MSALRPPPSLVPSRRRPKARRAPPTIAFRKLCFVTSGSAAVFVANAETATVQQGATTKLDGLRLFPEDEEGDRRGGEFATSSSTSFSSSSQIGADGKTHVSRSVNFSFGPFESEKVACAACLKKIPNGESDDILCMASSAAVAADTKSGGDSKGAENQRVAFARGTSRNIMESNAFRKSFQDSSDESLCRCSADGNQCAAFDFDKDQKKTGSEKKQGGEVTTTGDDHLRTIGFPLGIDRSFFGGARADKAEDDEFDGLLAFPRMRSVMGNWVGRDLISSDPFFADSAFPPNRRGGFFASGPSLNAWSPFGFSFGGDRGSSAADAAFGGSGNSIFEGRNIFNRIDSDIFKGDDSKFLGVRDGGVQTSRVNPDAVGGGSGNSHDIGAPADGDEHVVAKAASSYSMSSQFGPFPDAGAACSACGKMGYGTGEGKDQVGGPACYAATSKSQKTAMALAATADVVAANTSPSICACSGGGSSGVESISACGAPSTS